MVYGFFHFFESAGGSATMSSFASQYMTSSSPRLLQASAARVGTASDAPANANTSGMSQRVRRMFPPRVLCGELYHFVERRERPARGPAASGRGDRRQSRIDAGD